MTDKMDGAENENSGEGSGLNAPESTPQVVFVVGSSLTGAVLGLVLSRLAEAGVVVSPDLIVQDAEDHQREQERHEPDLMDRLSRSKRHSLADMLDDTLDIFSLTGSFHKSTTGHRSLLTDWPKIGQQPADVKLRAAAARPQAPQRRPDRYMRY